MKAWLAGLSIGKKIALGVGSFLAVTTIAGAVSTPITPAPATNTQQEQPTTETREEKEVSPINFDTVNKDDGNLAIGTTSVSQEGAEGERTIIYEVTYTDGNETSRKEISNEITKKPVEKIVLTGTYVKPKPVAVTSPSNCDPNYSGCVPVAYDVDCEGGSGNGPEYTGYTTVIGTDIYDLDRDGDGVACE